jgi:hypothetical protein
MTFSDSHNRKTISSELLARFEAEGDAFSRRIVTADEICRVKNKAVPLQAMEALGGRGDITFTHSPPRQ